MQLQIPYIFRRDSVLDGRDRSPLFLKDKTKFVERELFGGMKHRFDEDAAQTDLREGLQMVALEHLDEAEDQLAEWRVRDVVRGVNDSAKILCIEDIRHGQRPTLHLVTD